MCVFIPADNLAKHIDVRENSVYGNLLGGSAIQGTVNIDG